MYLCALLESRVVLQVTFLTYKLCDTQANTFSPSDDIFIFACVISTILQCTVTWPSVEHMYLFLS